MSQNMSESDGGTIAATFPDRGSANEALTELYQAGFRNVWLGVMQSDATTGASATVASGDAADSEGAQEQALHQALIAHGLRHDQARRLEAIIPSGAAIVTVDSENDPDEALLILQTKGGNVDSSLVGSATKGASPLNDARRLQLREERLLIDKQPVLSGEARIRKEVVTEQQSIDVPVFREEFFIRRRPVGEDAVDATTPIGEEGEEIRIPLSAERVDVQKRTVVTEQVEIGKRKVQGTEQINDSVRREELRVDDDGLSTTVGEPEKQQFSRA